VARRSVLEESHAVVVRGAFFHKGRHYDVEEFSLLRSEIEQTQL
jgi:hypothetical protein